MTRYLIFDFGGVLVNLDRRRCVDAFTRIGAGAIACYVDECRQEDLFHDLEVGQTDIPQFCDAVRRACPGCIADDEAICEAWNALLTGIPRYRLERLDELKRDYRIVLLSNTNPIHWGKAAACYFTACGRTVDYYFEKTFLSYEMHLLKPDEAIYRRVLDDTGFNACETLFIDDSAANCTGAEKLGVNTLHVDLGEPFCGLRQSAVRKAVNEPVKDAFLWP